MTAPNSSLNKAGSISHEESGSKESRLILIPLRAAKAISHRVVNNPPSERS